MGFKKDKYEISLWEDYIVSAQGEGDNFIPEHYEERKVAVIGSDTMSAQWRAREPKLVENVNGTNVLTFKMFYSYIDNETGEKEQNPMLKLLVNERKVKCFWKNKWYDLVIKSYQEDSNGSSIVYTCKDLFINELSKTGFDLEFDTELENNQGTIDELAAVVLEGTDWQLGESDIIRQYIEEPVYEILVQKGFTAIDKAGKSVEIKNGDTILVFYSVFNNRPEFFQFWYDKSQNFLRDKTSMLVNSGECLSAEVTWEETTWNNVDSWGILLEENTIAYISKVADLSERYRAKRLVRSQVQILDPLTDKYVYIYNKIDDNKKIYGYTETQYNDASIIVNYITNSKDFGSLTGWSGTGLTFQLYPLFSSEVDNNYSSKSYLKIPSGQAVFNSGIKDFRAYIEEGFTIGEEYIFRFKAMTNSETEPDAPSGNYCVADSNYQLKPWIGKYTLNADTNEYERTGLNYFSYELPVQKGDWVEYTLTCKESASYEDLLKLGLFIDNIPGENETFYPRWIENVQFFKYSIGDPVAQEYSSTKLYTEDEIVFYNNKYYICFSEHTDIKPESDVNNPWELLGEEKPSIRINPGNYGVQSLANLVWKFYEADQSVLKVEDLTYLYSGDEDGAKEYIKDNLEEVYNNDYEKIRSITAKNSNRFNLIQSLCETFECWAKFEIDHDEETGRISYGYYDEDGNYVYTGPQKYVRFVEKIGKETGIGFIYGIDLKTISRTINSDSISSKVIVAQNNNEFGKDGFCTIARASENYPRVNFILNFDYFISQGLLSQGQINKDLYSSVEQTGIGYYYWLNKYNTGYDAITELLQRKTIELDKQKALQKVYEGNITEISTEISRLEGDLASYAGLQSFNYDSVKSFLEGAGKEHEKAQNAWIVRGNLKNSLMQFSSQSLILQESIKVLDESVTGFTEQQKEYTKLIEELDKKFYEKYSRFIQEGSWTSEDYYDDNLYYLDAVSTAYTSSRPQIQYNISVLRLSALDEYKHKVFNLGDISFIQDTEFFGYINIDGIKTPYREKVLVSEITSNFESPENDSFKVQNYKTQFEDLFQRITATTQSLQYSQGAYTKVAASFTPTGEIKTETLQNSFALNQNLAWAAENDSVVYDTTGMTVTDTSDPTKQVRITSKGIFITEDGGENWYLGISGSGISTRYLTSGIVTTDKINIMDGAYPTFKWDKYGLSAYSYELSDDGQISQVNNGNFVRFDRFGIYGINTENSDNWKPKNEAEIWDTAKFGLTWKGFFMKNKYGNGYVSISSEDDFIVSDGANNRIKIGNIGNKDNPIYGLSITDGQGQKVMETNENGTLWLKNRLNIETYDSDNSVGIGKLDDEETKDQIHGGRVINANNKFLVYEDGSIKATDGEFAGIIKANSGTIGGFIIGENSIISAGYQETKDETYVSGKTYYELIDGEYIITTDIAFGEGKTYYEYLPNGNIELFSAGGLTINNGGFVINRDSEYIITKDSAPKDEKKYYVLSNNTYIETNVASFETGETYYEHCPKITLFGYNEDSRTLSIQGSGSFTGNVYATDGEFKGTVYATDGEFKGTVYATDGEFTGSIIAKDGTIGGFIIGENSIISAGYQETKDETYVSGKTYYELIDGEYIITTDIAFGEGKTYYEYLPNGSIKLFNDPRDNSGIIQVDNIELGSGAKIKDYIELGNAYIYNPDKHNNSFISIKRGYVEIKDTKEEDFDKYYLFNEENNIYVLASEVQENFNSDSVYYVYDGVTDYINITNKGVAKFGNITIDGVNSEIYSGDTAGDGNFTITPERSIFKNIDVTGTIHSSVFETGQVQNVGGAMIFRESAEIKILQNGNITTFETLTDINLKIGSYVLLTNDSNLNAYGYIRSIKENNQYTVEVKTDASDATVVVHLADESDGNFSNHLLIGVNSQEETNKNLLPKAITFSELRSVASDTYAPQYSTPKILLGDLSPLKDKDIEGFGLYGENVYLTGSLTTQVNPNSYAGVNTLNGAIAVKFDEASIIDKSKIVFWAGADGTDAESIQDSKFQVTENGSLYAARGLFEGSIITNSTIQASALYAISLFGGTEKETAALNIYDTEAGIIFWDRKNNEDENDEETLRLNANGFSIDGGNSNFIKIEEEGTTRKVFFDGEQLRANTIITRPVDANYLSLSGNSINAYGVDETPTSLGNLTWGTESGSAYYSININVDGTTDNKITQDKNGINLSTNLVQVKENIYFGQKMKYEKTTNGYDLYVSD